MAASIKLYGDTYNYTISNITNVMSCTPSNRSSRYGAIYSKLTVSQNKAGSHTRYIFLHAGFFKSGTAADLQFQPANLIAEYKAVWSSSGTSATVTEIATNKAIPMGRTWWTVFRNPPSGYTAVIVVSISTSDNVANSFDAGGVTYSISYSGWNPSTPTLNYAATQSSSGDPDPSVFGLIAGYAKASWSASGNTTWSYSLNGFTGTINPNQTLTLSANGASSTSAAGTGTRSASLASKLISATSVTGTAKITNVIGGSATATKTLTVQSYSKPTARSLAIGRISDTSVTPAEANHASMSIGWAVNILNKQSTASADIQTGAITVDWECEDLGNEGVTFSSGTFDIISNGESMTVTDDTATEMLVDADTDRNNNIYDPDHSYRFTAYITDRIGQSSLTITAVLASDFYLICAREGGRGIAFGGIANHENEFTVYNKLYPYLRGTTEDSDTGETIAGTFYRAVREDSQYGQNIVSFGVGSGGINKGIWCENYNSIDGHWMIKEGADGETILNKFYPVGSVVITYTNSSPASRFGGSWSLFDKEYKYSWISSGFTFNTTNTTEGQFAAVLTGKAAELRFIWKNKVAMSDDSVAIGTMNMSTIGMSGVHNSYGVCWNDALGGIGMMRFAWSDGVLTLYVDDWATRATSYPTSTGQWCYMSAVILPQGTSMTDSFCDKFYWRRTA